VLIPVERPAESLLAGKLIDLAWPPDAPATVLAVGTASDAATRLISEVLERRPKETVPGQAGDPLQAVLAQLRLGYGVVGIGSQEGVEEGAYMSALTDGLLAATSQPVIMVQSGPTARLDAFTGFSRILVPVAGTLPNRLAQEVAFSAAATSGAELVIAHVVPTVDLTAAAASGGQRAGAEDGGQAARRGPGTVATAEVQQVLADHVLTDAAELAERLGARPTTVLRSGASPAAEIVALTEELRPDLVVLGSQLHPGTPDRPFLGHFTEQVLAVVSTHVAVVAVPQSWRAPTQ
jgi:nucleotide-binding universal stress UspA family protein